VLTAQDNEDYAVAVLEEETWEFDIDTIRETIDTDIPEQSISLEVYRLTGILEDIYVSEQKLKIMGYDVMVPGDIYLDDRIDLSHRTQSK